MEHRQNAGAVKRFLVWSAQVRISLAVSPATAGTNVPSSGTLLVDLASLAAAQVEGEANWLVLLSHGMLSNQLRRHPHHRA
jgi:hypothetical protein